jgi:hypothetical protein
MCPGRRSNSTTINELNELFTMPLLQWPWTCYTELEKSLDMGWELAMLLQKHTQNTCNKIHTWHLSLLIYVLSIRGHKTSWTGNLTVEKSHVCIQEPTVSQFKFPLLLRWTTLIPTINSGKWPTWSTVSSIICLFDSSTCFEQLCAHLQEDSCVNTTSGIITVC